MYDYVKGKVTKIKSNGITVETAGIGYFIFTANPYAFSLDKEYTVYLYQVVREDELSLFGFIDEEERNIFLKLISVKGLGPRMTLPIIATGEVSSIAAAIESENLAYLKKFPKIGDKLARQIILDLKGKLGDVDTSIVNDTNTDELKEVLTSLGYKDKEIKKVLPKIDTTISLEEQVKVALKLLLV